MRGAAARGVLLLAHGAPETPSEVPAFLMRVRGGRPLPPAAVAAYQARYERIGGTSPLAATTRGIAHRLARALNLPVYLATRHGSPTVTEGLDRAAADGVHRLSAICLTPYEGRYASDAYRETLDHALRDHGAGFSIDFVRSWHRESSFIDGLSDAAAEALAQMDGDADRAVVIFSAHSVPVADEDGRDPYPDQVTETAASVARRLNLERARWRVAYQSAPSRTRRPWLEPSLTDVVATAASEWRARWSSDAMPHIVVVPIGFVIDNLETLYDLDIELKERAAALDIRLERAQALNERPALIAALAGAVKRDDKERP